MRETRLSFISGNSVNHCSVTPPDHSTGNKKSIYVSATLCPLFRAGKEGSSGIRSFVLLFCVTHFFSFFSISSFTFRFLGGGSGGVTWLFLFTWFYMIAVFGGAFVLLSSSLACLAMSWQNYPQWGHCLLEAIPISVLIDILLIARTRTTSHPATLIGSKRGLTGA